MRPIRGQRQQEVAHDPWQGHEQPTGQRITGHFLNQAGALESHEVAHAYASGCGCLQPPAGFCSECMRTSCARCHGFCEICHKPCCPAHSRFVVDDAGGHHRRCRSCHEASRRKGMLMSVARFFLSPFLGERDA